jgi:hypothetical protein
LLLVCPRPLHNSENCPPHQFFFFVVNTVASSPQTMIATIDDALLHHIEGIGLEILGMKMMKKGAAVGGGRQYSEKIKNRRFIASFGATPFICAIVWNELKENNWFRRSPARRVKPCHLFMGLHFLKGYNTEESNATMFQCDEKTFRQWSWYIVSGIANLEKRYGGWSTS